MKRTDLTGKTFGVLTVVALSENYKPGKVKWDCICQCGNITPVRSNNLMSGNTISCGCKATQNALKHGMEGSSTYNIWHAMRSRCSNKNVPHYHRYGGRGITVCDRWMNSFEHFLADMGERPQGMSIERVNNNKGYSPGNCKWATSKEQGRNQRTNRMLTYQGETKTLVEWSEILNIDRALISNRLRKGWTTDRALSTKKRRFKWKNMIQESI